MQSLDEGSSPKSKKKGKASKNKKNKQSGKVDGQKKPEEEVAKGVECDTKSVYETIDKHGRTMWSEKHPEDIDPPVENEASMHSTTIQSFQQINLQHIYSCSLCNSCSVQKVVSATQETRNRQRYCSEPLLKEALREVLEGHPGITTTIARLEFHAPFKPFIHR